MKKRHRIFIAINLPEEVKRKLFSYAEKWPELPAKWTAKENLHITLEFLGDLTDIEIGEVCKITAEVAKKHPSFSIMLKKIVYGPSHLRFGEIPRMIWAIGESPKELIDLKNDLEQSLLKFVRFAPESRNFSPHITLARLNSFAFRQMEIEEMPDINEPLDIVFTVESIEIMESILKREGPQYYVVESCQLSS